MRVLGASSACSRTPPGQGYSSVDFSGFDPAVFAAEHYALYSRLPFKVWRLAFDEEREANDVERVIQCLRACGVPSNQIAAYVVVGFDDSPAESLARAIRVIEWRGEPRVQAYRPLTWLDSDRPLRQSRARVDDRMDHGYPAVLLR